MQTIVWKLVSLSSLMPQQLCTAFGKDFPSKYFLRIHNLQVHNSSRINCDECGKNMNNKKHLRNHLKTHRTISCKNCNKTIPQNSNTSHSCGDQNFKCEQCNYKSKQKSHLDRHMKVHAPKVPKLMKEYNCFHCKKTFDRKFNLKVHVKTHTKLKVQQEFH